MSSLQYCKRRLINSERFSVQGTKVFVLEERNMYSNYYMKNEGEDKQRNQDLRNERKKNVKERLKSNSKKEGSIKQKSGK
jgi:hypothetical protein